MVTADEILDRAVRRVHADPRRPGRARGSAPAETFLVNGGPARVGVIGSVTRPFCGTCDRVRLTADGQVRNCLFARDESDLRDPLRAGASDDELAAHLARGGRRQAARPRHQRPRVPAARPADVRHRRLTGRARVARPRARVRRDRPGRRPRTRLGGTDKPGLVVGGRTLLGSVDGGRDRGRGGPGRGGRPGAPGACPADEPAGRRRSAGGSARPPGPVPALRRGLAGIRAGGGAARRRPAVPAAGARRAAAARRAGRQPGPRARCCSMTRPPAVADQLLGGGAAPGGGTATRGAPCAGCSAAGSGAAARLDGRRGSRRPGWTATPRDRAGRGRPGRERTGGTPVNTLDEWTEAVCRELGLDPAAAGRQGWCWTWPGTWRTAWRGPPRR